MDFFQPLVDLFNYMYSNIQLFLDSWGYFAIFFLMTIESSFIPFPSEAVIVPAGALASAGNMSLALVIFFGTLGSIVGALVNYVLGKYLGKPLVYKLARKKWAKYLLINEEKIKNAEEYFTKYGRISTFLGRLVPGIRQLISIPAGFVNMHIPHFIIYTGLGAGLWVTILAYLGYIFGTELEGGSLMIWIAIIIVLMIGGYSTFIHIHKKHKKKKAQQLSE